MPASVTLHPHVCGRCESAVAPFCSALTGKQCGCPEPSSPTPVSNGNLCFYTLGLPASEPVASTPALDSTALMRMASGEETLEEAAQRTGPDLLDIRAALIVAAARFPLSDEALHMAFDDRDFRSSDHAEAMERLDNGERLALSMAQRVMEIADPKPEPIDEETAKQIGSDLLDLRAQLVVTTRRIPLAGNDDLHQWFNALVNGVDAVAAELAERWAS